MDFFKARELLVEQLQREGITNQHVLNAFKRVPREDFVPDESRTLAYLNSPISIGHEQTTSQPYTIATMMEMLDPQPGDTVLEVGTGTGYQAALLSQIVHHVYTIERIPELAKQAKNTLGRLQYQNVTVLHGDGTCGYQDQSPFDEIIVTAGAPQVPQPLLDQLKEGGRIVIPVGTFWDHSLVKILKKDDTIERQETPGFMFVPLVGECGWEE